METAFGIFGISIFAGGLGAIVGLGGGIIIIPALTLMFGINIRYAIGASIVSVIATSSGAAATYVRDHITNVRLAIFLEVATTFGAVFGALLSAYLKTDWLFILFAALLFHSAYIMWQRGRKSHLATSSGTAHSWATKLHLNSKYLDPHLGKDVHYLVEKVPLGFIYMLGAGLISGLLGIGSGVLKVLAMDSAMKLPIKASSATSNFMIGVTAAASAGAYYMRGDIVPQIAAPVAIGVMFGAWIGTKLMVRLPSKTIRNIFTVVLFVIAIQMALRGLRYGL